MRGWTWSVSVWRWEEWLVFGLAAAANQEAPHYSSELVRGIAIALQVGALVSMLRNRRALGVLLFALALFALWRFGPYEPQHSAPVSVHVMAVLLVMAPLFAKWVAARRAKLAALPAVDTTPAR